MKRSGAPLTAGAVLRYGFHPERRSGRRHLTERRTGVRPVRRMNRRSGRELVTGAIGYADGSADFCHPGRAVVGEAPDTSARDRLAVCPLNGAPRSPTDCSTDMAKRESKLNSFALPRRLAPFKPHDVLPDGVVDLTRMKITSRAPEVRDKPGRPLVPRGGPEGQRHGRGRCGPLVVCGTPAEDTANPWRRSTPESVIT